MQNEVAGTLREMEAVGSRLSALQSVAADIERIRLQLPLLERGEAALEAALERGPARYIEGDDFFGKYHEEMLQAKRDIAGAITREEPRTGG